MISLKVEVTPKEELDYEFWDEVAGKVEDFLNSRYDLHKFKTTIINKKED